MNRDQSDHKWSEQSRSSGLAFDKAVLRGRGVSNRDEYIEAPDEFEFEKCRAVEDTSTVQDIHNPSEIIIHNTTLAHNTSTSEPKPIINLIIMLFKSIITVLPFLSLLTSAHPISNSTGSEEEEHHNHLSKRAIPIVRNCNVPNQIALTFDDGPFRFDRDLVRTLGNNKGTFFINGNNYGCIYDYADDL